MIKTNDNSHYKKVLQRIKTRNQLAKNLKVQDSVSPRRQINPALWDTLSCGDIPVPLKSLSAKR